MDGRGLPSLEDTYPKWNGYSVGRWEGETLVVESIGFDGRSPIGSHRPRGSFIAGSEAEPVRSAST